MAKATYSDTTILYIVVTNTYEHHSCHEFVGHRHCWSRHPCRGRCVVAASFCRAAVVRRNAFVVIRLCATSQTYASAIYSLTLVEQLRAMPLSTPHGASRHESTSGPPLSGKHDTQNVYARRFPELRALVSYGRYGIRIRILPKT